MMNSMMTKSVHNRELKIKSSIYPLHISKNRRSVSAKPPPEKSSIKDDIPGLKLVFDKDFNKLYRSFWLLFLIISCTTCVYQIFDRITFYLSEPTRTDIEAVRTQYMKFPSFTVCPGSGQYPQILSNMTQEARKKVSLFTLIDKYPVLDLWNMTSILNITIAGFFAHKMEASQPALNIRKQISLYGICHTYELPDPINFYDAANIFTVGFNWTFIAISGHILTILHPDEDYYGFYHHLIKDAVLKQQKANYPMKLTVYKRLPLRRRPCDDKFAVGKCRQKCHEEAVVKNITCRTPNINDTRFPFCNNYTSFHELISSLYYMGKNFDVYSNCSHCKIKCEENIYEAGTTYSFERTPDCASQSFYYESNIVYTVTESIAYTLISLLCDIGGNLGLYLGLCLVTVAQLLENCALSVLKIFSGKDANDKKYGNVKSIKKIQRNNDFK